MIRLKAPVKYRLMTYNIGGGRDDNRSDLDAIAAIIREYAPDIVAVQETASVQAFDHTWRRDLDVLGDALGPGAVSAYAATVTLQEHLHPNKVNMVDALFADHRDWQQGNALLSRWSFHRLGKRDQPGDARNVPLFRPVQYRGNRDTDPRAALIARIGHAPLYPIAISTHLTTLVGERGDNHEPDKYQIAAEMREEQARLLLRLLRRHALDLGEIIFLMGDFNATFGEAAIGMLIDEGGFTWLRPGNNCPTHPKMPEPIDHIFAYAPGHQIDYTCTVIDTPAAHEASDHLPVFAEVTIS